MVYKRGEEEKLPPHGVDGSPPSFCCSASMERSRTFWPSNPNRFTIISISQLLLFLWDMRGERPKVRGQGVRQWHLDMHLDPSGQLSNTMQSVCSHKADTPDVKRMSAMRFLQSMVVCWCQAGTSQDVEWNTSLFQPVQGQRVRAKKRGKILRWCGRNMHWKAENKQDFPPKINWVKICKKENTETHYDQIFTAHTFSATRDQTERCSGH